MNRKMNATDLKIRTLLRSQMMKWLEFRKLVTKVDRFFYDQKLYELMKKKHSRKVNTGDHKFDFYNILLELLYEVHRNDSSEQAKLLERVLEWHRVNQVKLEFAKNVAPRSAPVAQLLECRSTMQVNQQKGKDSPKGSPNSQKSTVGKTSIIQPHTCTDENGVCSSATTLKSTQSNQTKVITTPEIVTLKDFPESRNLTEQHSPTDHQRKEKFQPLIERTFHTQVSSQQKRTENPFFKRKATLNLGDLINAANATTAPINISTRKRAQSVPVHQFRTASKATEVNPQQTGVPRSAKGGNIYHDWRGLISPESSGPVVEFQRTLLAKKVLKNRRQKQLVPQSNAQKALSSFLWKSDTTSQRFQETKVGVSGTNAWRGAAMENTQSESLQRSDPEQVDQSISSLSPFFCHDCQAKFHRGIHCVLCMARYCKMQGVSSANLPNVCINLSQGANMMLKQKQFDGVGAHRKDSEKTGQSLCNRKKIEITSNVIPDQPEDISIANRGHVSTTESSFDGHVSICQSSTRDNKQINETLEFSAHFQENGISTFATTNKEEQHDKIKQEKTSSLIENESTFQTSQNGEAPTDYLPRTSCDEDFLTLINKTGHLSVKLYRGQQMHLSLLKPVDFQECYSSTFDYQQTVQVFQLSVIGHRINQKPSPKVEAGEICELEEDTVKRPADLKKKPSKTERSVSMHFQPGDRAAKPKATECQKNASAALGIHDIITRYVSKEYAPETRSIQKEKKEKQLSEQMKWKRQNQLLAEKIRTIYSRPKDAEMKARHKVLLKERLHHETKRKVKTAAYKQILQNFNALRNRRLEDSRPHDELIDASYPQRTGPSPYQQKMAATFIQKFVRGWLQRITYNRIKIKALGHGKSLSAVVRHYRQMMTRLRRRFDAPWEPIPLVYSDLEDWLDRKKKYEDMFAKREFWKEMNKNELPNFFHDSDHYPSLREINETWALINAGSYNNQPETLTKKQVVELAFTIYPPSGAGLGDRSIYRSTWVRPVVNGEEGFKYILSDHPVLQEAKIEVVGDLVARSMFRRNQIQKFSRNVFTDYLTRAVPMK